MTRVKMCGITTLGDALACVDAGADALGFIFVENTPRYVTAAQAKAIVRALPPFVTPVGVFWDHPRAHVKAVVETCGLRAVQLHGGEGADDVAGYEVPVIKTMKLPPGATVADAALSVPDGVAAILLDSAARWSEGEARAPIEWTTAAAIVARLGGTPRAPRVILSAGLTPDTVARAIAVVKPYAVDVSSGVEAAPGRKDPDKVRRFMAAVRGAA